MLNHQKPWARGLESLCLKKLKEIGGKGNARELAQAIDQPMDNISPRLNALARAGLIRDTGERESTGWGRPLIVWIVTDQGWETFSGRNSFADVRAALTTCPQQIQLL